MHAVCVSQHRICRRFLLLMCEYFQVFSGLNIATSLLLQVRVFPVSPSLTLSHRSVLSTLMTSCSTSTHPYLHYHYKHYHLHTVSKSSFSRFLPRACTSIYGIQMNNYLVLTASWFLSLTYHLRLQVPQWHDVFKLSFLLVILHGTSWYHLDLSVREMVWFELWVWIARARSGSKSLSDIPKENHIGFVSLLIEWCTHSCMILFTINAASPLNKTAIYSYDHVHEGENVPWSTTYLYLFLRMAIWFTLLLPIL